MSEQPRVGDRKPQKGDRVRVMYEAVWDEDRGTHYWLRDEADGTTASVPASADVEVLEPVDDPSKDPVGMVRSDSGSVAIRVDSAASSHEPWVVLGDPSVNFRDEQVTGWEVIGVVPGTPAAFLQQEVELDKPLPEWEMELLEREHSPKPGPRPPSGWEPKVWHSDEEEPPARVKALEWLDGDPNPYRYLIRVGSGWLWSLSESCLEPDHQAAPNDWKNAVRVSPGRYREVPS